MISQLHVHMYTQVEMDVELRTLTGTHITPLTQSVFLDVPEELGIPDILSQNSFREQIEKKMLITINAVKSEVIDWLDAKVRRR